MVERWLIEVDAAACTGSGLCVGCAPEHFALGEDHRSRALQREVDADAAVSDAAECCPMEAISVVSLTTGRRLFPSPDDSPAWRDPSARDGALAADPASSAP